MKHSVIHFLLWFMVTIFLFGLSGVMYALPAADLLTNILALALAIRLYKKEINPSIVARGTRENKIVAQ